MLGQYPIGYGAYRLWFLLDWAFTEEAILFGGGEALPKKLRRSGRAGGQAR